MDASLAAALTELVRLTECVESAALKRQHALIKARELASWGALAGALGVDRGTVRHQYRAAVKALAQREQENRNGDVRQVH